MCKAKIIVAKHMADPVPNNILYKISILYKACIKLRYTPSYWYEADVIFLAKPEKPRYDVHWDK